MPVPIQHLSVADQDGVLAIGRDDLVRYAGPSQIVASALVIRLFDRAFAELSPDRPPHRDEIAVLTAFPGDGILDCVEMLTRARTRGRLTVDPTAGPAWAPPAPGGRFWFEVAIGGRRRGYALKPGVFPDDFVAAIGRHQEGRGTPAELAAYQIAKHALIGRLLGSPAEDLFTSVEVVPA
jgi:hypothetical protein